MQREESLYPPDWFRVAGRDLQRAEALFNLADYEGAGFHLQQAVEKHLKGYLLSKGWRLRRIHNLDTLLNDAVVFDPSLEEFRQSCIAITQYYLEERYPLVSESAIGKDDIERSLAAAKELIGRLLTA